MYKKIYYNKNGVIMTKEDVRNNPKDVDKCALAKKNNLDYSIVEIVEKVNSIIDFIEEREIEIKPSFTTRKLEHLEKENEYLKRIIDVAIETLKKEVSYLMPYEIYKDDVELIQDKVINILNQGDNNE